MPETEQLRSTIEQIAREEGFARMAVAPAEAVATHEQFRRWIDRGCHASMEYLARNLELRQRPNRLVEGARSVICLAVSYAPPVEPAPEPLPAGAYGGQGEGLPEEGWHDGRRLPPCLPESGDRRHFQTTKMEPVPIFRGRHAIPYPGLVARYARGRDYHKVLKARCIRVMDRIRRVEPSFDGRAFVDSAPIMERSLAAAGGLGWIGQNGCLVVPGLGSYVLLAEIVCNLPLPPGEPLTGECDDCGRCAGACPTSAILPDGLIDCRRCISYLTIEHRGPVEPQHWRRIGTRVFGCDACQEACPHNQGVEPGDPELAGDGRPLGGAAPRQILAWTADDWDLATRGSATRRATHERFVRNAILAAGNSGDRSLIEPLRALRQAGGQDPEMIDWAIERLSEEDDA